MTSDSSMTARSRTPAAPGLTVVGALSVVGMAPPPTTRWHPAFPSLRPFPFEGTGQPGRIALSFDDGPNPPWTGHLAGVLAAHQVRATLFELGACAARPPAMFDEARAQGLTLIGGEFCHPAEVFQPDPMCW